MRTTRIRDHESLAAAPRVRANLRRRGLLARVPARPRDYRGGSARRLNGGRNPRSARLSRLSCAGACASARSARVDRDLRTGVACGLLSAPSRNGFTASDLLEDGFELGDPNEGFGVGVVGLEVILDRLGEVGDAVKHAAADCLVGELPQPALDEFQPRARGRVKCTGSRCSSSNRSPPGTLCDRLTTDGQTVERPDHTAQPETPN